MMNLLLDLSTKQLLPEFFPSGVETVLQLYRVWPFVVTLTENIYDFLRRTEVTMIFPLETQFLPGYLPAPTDIAIALRQ